MTNWSEIATTRVLVDLRTIVGDAFTRTESNGWGTSTNGVAWSTSGGSAGDYACNGSASSITLASVSTVRATIAAPTMGASEHVVRVRVSQLAAGDTIEVGLRAMYQDANNAYWFTLYFGTDQTVSADLSAQVGGVFTSLDSDSTGMTHVVDGWYWLKARVESDGTLRMRVWRQGAVEPTSWLLQGTSTAFASGQVMLYTFLGGSSTNVNPVVYFDDFTASSLLETLVEIPNAKVLTVGDRGQPLHSTTGRATELAKMDPSTFAMVVDNRDGRFTPDNREGVYYPWWKQGRRVVWTETIGYETFSLADGFLEIPEVAVSFEAPGDPDDSDRATTVSAIDLVTWLGRTEPFISTLGAHIVASVRNEALKLYWPLNDPAPPFADVVGNNPAFISFTSGALAPADEVVEPGSDPIAPGDDAPSLRLQWSSDPGVGSLRTPILGVSDGTVTTGHSTAIDPIQFDPSDVITVIVWLKPNRIIDTTSFPLILSYATSGNTVRFSHSSSSTNEVFCGVVGSVVGSQTVPAGVANKPYMLGFQFTPSTGSLLFWVDGTQYVVSTAGTEANPNQLRGLVGIGQGSYAHVQLYVGSATDYTFADYQAQREVGLYGFERQTTGERIRTVAGYAGIPTSAMDHIDTGSSVMPVASLAGKTALQAIQEPVETERGRLFTTGGQLVFHDRHRIYNG